MRSPAAATGRATRPARARARRRRCVTRGWSGSASVNVRPTHSSPSGGGTSRASARLRLGHHVGERRVADVLLPQRRAGVDRVERSRCVANHATSSVVFERSNATLLPSRSTTSTGPNRRTIRSHSAAVDRVTPAGRLVAVVVGDVVRGVDRAIGVELADGIRNGIVADHRRDVDEVADRGEVVGHEPDRLQPQPERPQQPSVAVGAERARRPLDRATPTRPPSPARSSGGRHSAGPGPDAAPPPDPTSHPMCHVPAARMPAARIADIAPTAAARSRYASLHVGCRRVQPMPEEGVGGDTDRDECRHLGQDGAGERRRDRGDDRIRAALTDRRPPTRRSPRGRRRRRARRRRHPSWTSAGHGAFTCLRIGGDRLQRHRCGQRPSIAVALPHRRQRRRPAGDDLDRSIGERPARRAGAARSRSAAARPLGRRDRRARRARRPRRVAARARSTRRVAPVREAVRRAAPPAGGGDGARRRASARRRRASPPGAS